MDTAVAKAPVLFYPNFIADAESLHNRLWQELAFVRYGNRPRHEYWQNDFDLPYTYGKGAGERTYTPQPWHPAIWTIRDLIDIEIGAHMDCCFVNGYRDGSDHLNWHADDSPEMDDARPIVVISLGAEREIWFRPKGDKTAEVSKLSLPSGSAVVMLAGMQETHDHRIPKAGFAPCGPRISLTYRGLVI